MDTFSNRFGLMVAYVLPGFIALAGLAPLVPLVAGWLTPANYAEASLAPPVYAILFACTVGMVISCFRWLLIDQVHHLTGVKAPTWDNSRLTERLGAFNYLVENHYRYYQFTANSLISICWTYLINRWYGTSVIFGAVTDGAVLLLCIVLFFASRDALSKYYVRTRELIGFDPHATLGDKAMYNGNHRESVGTASASGQRKVKEKPPAEKAAKPSKNKPTPARPRD